MEANRSMPSLIFPCNRKDMWFGKGVWNGLPKLHIFRCSVTDSKWFLPESVLQPDKILPVQILKTTSGKCSDQRSPSHCFENLSCYFGVCICGPLLYFKVNNAIWIFHSIFTSLIDGLEFSDERKAYWKFSTFVVSAEYNRLLILLTKLHATLKL